MSVFKKCGRCKVPFESKLDNNFCPACIEEMRAEDAEWGDDACPKCGVEYDEIDKEYQICHYCKYDNNERN